MRGRIALKVGRYEWPDRVSLTIRTSDDGVVVVIDMPEAKQRYSAAISERGRVVWRRAEEVAAPGHNLGKPTFDPRTVQPKLPPGCRTARKASRIKFTLKWGTAYKPRNSCYVLGGYTDGRSLHVLYRVSGGFSGHDGLLCMTPDLISNGKGLPPEELLSDGRWEEFLALLDNATIHVGRPCRKLPLAELASIVGGRTIQMGRTEKRD